jgi:multidrug efflux pump subunit AcrA (membrane-fusion protein)
MDPSDLERLLDRELKRLRPPRAPRTLLPRVMSAAGQSLLPWYRRPWVTWPAGLQTASVGLLALVLAIVGTLLPSVQSAAQPLTSSVTGSLPNGLVTAAQRVNEGAALMKVLLQVFVQPVAAYLFALGIALTIACGVLWTAINRMALGGASQQ